MQHISLDNLQEAARYVREHLALDNKPQPQTAIILGSGLGAFAERIKNNPLSACIAFSSVPHFPSSTVVGHKGEIIYGMMDDTPVLLLNGRVHLYEGLQPQEVVIPTRVFALLGVKNLVLTNASGALDDHHEPGDLMVISDHLNFTGTSPLVGKNIDELGPRFLDLSVAYDPALRALAKKAAQKAGITMHEGVYACMLGPCYETPAEIRMLQRMGANAVGMSTVFETIAARHAGLNVLAIACLTNKGAGLTSNKINHDEVMNNNAKVSTKLSMILADVVNTVHRR